MWLDDAWWLAIVAFVLTAIAFALAAIFGYSDNLLILFGILSGVIYALTNANDRRAVNGRPCIGEPKEFEEVTFLAMAGFLGVFITWMMLPVMYFVFASSLDYSPQLGDDITAGFSASVAIGTVTIPAGFMWAGIFTILSTLAYLYVLKANTVEFLAIVGPCIYVIDIAAGLLLFGDKVETYEKLVIFPAIIFLFIALSFARMKTGSRHSVSLSAIGSLLIYIIVSSLVDLSIRGALENFDGTRQFFVSLCFRAAYFSTFLIFGIAWWLKYRRSASLITDLKEIIRTRHLGKFVLVIVTPLSFTLAFTLKMPVVSNNLAVGPILYFTGQTLALSLVGVLYKTDGSKTQLFARFKEVYLRSESQGIQRYAYLLLYLFLFVIVVVWLSLRLAV